MNNPGLAVCLSVCFTDSWDFPYSGNGSSAGSVGEEEADTHATSHWLAPGTEVTADVAVGISEPGRQHR